MKFRCFFAGAFVLLNGNTPFSWAQTKPDFDLLELPIGTTMTLNETIRFDESVSRQLRAITFQNGRILKKKEHSNSRIPHCDFAAFIPNTEKFEAQTEMTLCNREFMPSGNGKVYLDFRTDSECGKKSPGAAIICEAESADRDLMFSDLLRALGTRFSFSQDASKNSN